MKLSELSTLIVDPDHFTRGLVVQMLRSFEMRDPGVATDGASAKNWLAGDAADLVICEARLPDMNCAALIHWIRRCGPMQTRTVPILVLTGQPQFKIVTEARDSGASVVVRKPVSARVLLEHLTWAATSQRPFVHAGQYVGPDRRFRETAVPAYAERRLSPEQMAAELADADANDARILDHIAAIETVLALHGERELDAETRRSFLTHGDAILVRAGASGKTHLETVARGLCDMAAGMTPGGKRGTAPIAVHLQALQLLAPGKNALSGAAADRVLSALMRMLAHLNVESSLAVPGAAQQA